MRNFYFFSVLALSFSNIAAADTPIQAGDIDFIVSPIGYESMGIRYAHSENMAFYAKLDEFDLLTDQISQFNTGNNRYEDSSTEKDPTFGFSVGLQYFLTDGVYASAKTGYYTHRNSEDFESNATDDTERTFNGFHGSAIIGFEEPLTDRLALHSELEFQFGNRAIEDIETDSNGNKTAGTKTDRFYEETFFTLGFSYKIN